MVQAAQAGRSDEQQRQVVFRHIIGGQVLVRFPGRGERRERNQQSARPFDQYDIVPFRQFLRGGRDHRSVYPRPSSAAARCGEAGNR